MTEYLATEPLYIGLARAYSAGDPVSAKQVEKHPEWRDKVTLAEPAPGVSEPKIDDVLETVGTDKEKAAAAIEAEEAKPRPRKTLIEKLQAVVDADPGTS